MTKARRTREALPADHQKPQNNSVRPKDRSGLPICRGLIQFLFLFRFYYVAESADHGDTLGVAGAWLAALTIWILVSWRAAVPVVPFGWFDLGVGLLAGGHITSALLVVATSGDKRSAINLVWEWVGIAIGWFLLRQEICQPNFRKELQAGLIATGVCIAGLGLYQHYVEFPGMAAKFGPMFDRLKHADAAEAIVLRQAMARENIPVEGPSVTLFEKRLRDSREPLGFFALANTLGGFLAVCLLISVAAATAARTRTGSMWARWSVWSGFIVLIGWSLLLTKSRTAWIGTAIGLSLWICLQGGTFLTRSRLKIVVGTFAMVCLAAWGLSHFGGLDRQVFTEAPKSLQYRLQYWIATSRMIRDHLLFGIGPGQFRSHYLFYKLPQASEEIADPHNLFLDVAANGGLMALMGLISIIVLMAASLRSSQGGVDESPLEGQNRMNPVLLGFVLLAWVLLLVTGIDDRLLVLLPVAAVLAWILNGLVGRLMKNPNVLVSGCWGSAFGLLAHLCGAGGIGMPAVSLLLLALIALGIQGSSNATAGSRIPTKWAISSSIMVVVLLAAWFVTGYQPVSIVSGKMLAGDRLVERGQMEAADVQYLAASEADRWASEPWRRRAEIAYRKGNTDQYRSNESFQISVNLLEEAKRRDPSGFRDDQRLGVWWLARWNHSRDTGDATQALDAFSRAWERYPTNAELMSQVAFSLELLKFDARAKDVAGRALRQDEINHEWGHIDRFLDAATRIKLEQILDRDVQANED